VFREFLLVLASSGTYRSREIVRRERVQHVGPAKPAAAGHVHAETGVPKPVHRMGIRRHHESDATTTRRANPAWLEVESVRVAVHLDRGARFGDRIEDLLDVTRERRPAEHVTTERVSPDLEDRMAHCAYEATRHLPRVQTMPVVHARNDDLEPLEHVVRIVERAVAQDVALGPP